MAQYTGLSVQYVKDANLRINPSRFRKELMREDGDILGRYDARFEGSDVDNAGEIHRVTIRPTPALRAPSSRPSTTTWRTT